MSRYIFGVDIGGTTVKIGLFDEVGTKIEVWEIKTRTEDKGVNILPDIAESILKKTEEKNIAKSDIVGVGIGVPGPVDRNGVIHNAVNLGWGTFSVCEAMENLIGVKVAAGNDANVAALGEHWKGGGQGFEDMVMVTLGTGIGGGIIINGKLVAGVTGAAGEIGHIHLQSGEPDTCGCGNHGCFEQYGSATGVVRVGSRILSMNNKATILSKEEKLTSKAIFDAAAAGDEVAVEIVGKYGDYLGKGLAIIATTLNPEAIVLGGGVSKAGDTLLDLIRPSFQKYVFPGARGTEFKLATLGNDAGMYGAAKLVLD